LPALVLDAASSEPYVGLWLDAGDDAYGIRTSEEAGVGLFRSIRCLLAQHQTSIAALRSVVFCEGPGSLLGIRLASIAIRTWSALRPARPFEIYAYRSLELAAAGAVADGQAVPFAVLTDARRGAWNVLEVTEGNMFHPIRRVITGLTGPDGPPLFHLRGFPCWQALPASAQPLDYRPERLRHLALRYPLLRRTESPDAFVTQQAEYARWSPAITGESGTP
jgi:tRNA threonylcarbamoyladenosine biosynthesis protein TsaB